ncbi:hypothetical protein ASPWEDRAFT_174069 [Aspergillus wentii DTO 134E9]|uniref:Rhodopsin domain-containing protein n=1 Tax=Aspergillus wentii DTO 134E9 TaxID=1073089 RepID=A0A1L9RCI6_ASPWE|nr:uncharacterized protein ASPWEDRAFT_174069 [Aspergillus wentii DTO 134E9]OJJ32622.1 hypothetical protein ASPWEDRAFT_174069 [Aspergillus wentii DTO 134E9]
MAGPDYWRNILVVVPIVGTSVATIVYLLRLSCRYLSGTHIKAEDILMGIGLFFTYGVTGCHVVRIQRHWRVHSNLPEHLRMRTALVAWLAQKFWPPAQVFVKTSIVIFLRRLLGTIDGFRHIATGVIVFSIVWGSTAIIGNTFQCWPPQYFFVKHIEGHCMAGQNIFFIVMGSLSLAEDVVILCLPMPVVWKLQMATRQKIEMTIIFSIGGLVCAFSLLRLIYFRKYRTDDISGTAALESIWTILELDVAIICGSILLIKPLFQACPHDQQARLHLHRGKSRSVFRDPVGDMHHPDNGAE